VGSNPTVNIPSVAGPSCPIFLPTMLWMVELQSFAGRVLHVTEGSNVRGEPVFSVMAAGWFCEKSG
jgi:hypothetical protein